MSLPIFPTDFPDPLVPEVDQDSLGEDFTDSTIITEMDGNYKRTKPRSSRMPGTWTFAYKGADQKQYNAFIDFWHEVKGRAGSFLFTIPFGYKAGQQLEVRFTEKGKWTPYAEGYRGKITIEEV